MSHAFCKELLVWKKHLKNLEMKITRSQETAQHLRKKIKKKEDELKKMKGIQLDLTFDK